jgi:dipeptidyl aminopeptidase/acylaminoacyl peptidase
MKPVLLLTAAFLFSVPPALAEDAGSTEVAKPAALVADAIPPVPKELAAQTRPYMEFRSASFSDWNPQDRSMLIATRFGNTAQVHRVAKPGMARTQLTFEEEPVPGASLAPGRGDVMVVQKDNGGDEFFQIYRVESGALKRVTDGKSRNSIGSWTMDGARIGYSSTRRNGTDTDLYIVDPRNPTTDRRVAQVKGGGWNFTAFAPGGNRALVVEYVSVNKSNLWLIDVASGAMTPLGDHKKPIAYGNGEFAPDGTLWVTSDEGSDFQRLGTVDLKTGQFTPRGPTEAHDVESFDIAPDGSFIAYEANVDGASRLRLLDTANGSVRTVETPLGTIGGISIAPWGEIGFTLSSAKSPADAWSADPKTLAITRWTTSETGGLDATRNVEPEIVAVESFDGTRVSGLLYRPDPARFPGKRPLIMSIHGGPEGQSRPGFLGRTNYYLNALGVAVFLPNVRGSTGFGKRFVAMDNGPFKREDSVKDIGAFMTRLTADPAIDAGRIAVSGGSYGGYMCYASAIRYATQFKAAQCTVAISNFVTFLENTQAYRRDLRRVEYGDERVPAQRAKLIEISPMTRARELRVPLMVVTGGNDPRVPASEADQMVKAVRENGGLAWHLLGENEGHGFAKKENQDYQFWATLMFWQKTLLDAR